MNESKIFESVQDAYVNLNRELIEKYDNSEISLIPSRCGDMLETLSLNYRIKDPYNYTFDPEFGRFDPEYMDDFYSMLIHRGISVNDFIEKYPESETNVDARASAEIYKKRYSEQIPTLLDELTVLNSRRGVMVFLDGNDLAYVRLLNSRAEYPCLSNIQINIREGIMYPHILFRSQSLGRLFQLDMYVWCRCLCEISDNIGVDMGELNCTVVSAHTYESDIDRLLEEINFGNV